MLHHDEVSVVSMGIIISWFRTGIWLASTKFFDQCRDKHQMDIPPKNLSIAYLELLAALISIVCFSALCRGRFVRLNRDNTNAVSW